MSSINLDEFKLYIKRAELNHNEEYISNAFSYIGVVKNIKFISKTNEKGENYNGVIVYFERLHLQQDKLTTRLEELKTKKTMKFYHNNCYYWIIQEYISSSEKKTECKMNELTRNAECRDIVTLTNEELKNEYKILKKRCETQETKMMEYEEKVMRKWLENVDLELQVFKTKCYVKWKEDEINENLKRHEEEINNKNKRIECLEQDLELATNMLSYYEQKYGNYRS
jgi:hypothetical protein